MVVYLYFHHYAPHFHIYFVGLAEGLFQVGGGTAVHQLHLADLYIGAQLFLMFEFDQLVEQKEHLHFVVEVDAGHLQDYALSELVLLELQVEEVGGLSFAFQDCHRLFGLEVLVGEIDVPNLQDDLFP